MKIIHQDPKLRAQRIAAIKKAKGTAAARKHASETLKAYFSNPENRQKRSIAMKGVKFYCKNCGQEGHRRHYCPELKDSLDGRRFICRLCGEEGHNRRTCRMLSTSKASQNRCKVCGEYGHNRRSCPNVVDANISKVTQRAYKCGICHLKGHNSRTCPCRSIVFVASLNNDFDNEKQ